MFLIFLFQNTLPKYFLNSQQQFLLTYMGLIMEFKFNGFFKVDLISFAKKEKLEKESNLSQPTLILVINFS